MTTAYEDAIAHLGAPGSFVAIGTIRKRVSCVIRIRGINEPLTWPLESAQAKQIRDVYPNKIIPAAAMNIVFFGMGSMLTEAYNDTETELGLSGYALHRLSHMVLDDVGDSDGLRWIPTTDFDDDPENDRIAERTIGTLVFVLPSAYTGGVLTYSHGESTGRTLDASQAVRKTPYAAAFTSTTIVSAPITSGCRVALVYHMYYKDVHPRMRVAPVDPDAGIAAQTALRALAQAATRPYQLLAMPLLPLNGEVCFGNLTAHDYAVVDALVATDCFDVALATLDDRLVTEEDVSEYGTEYAVRTTLYLHRACRSKLGNLSSDAKEAYKPHAYLYHRPEWQPPVTVLAFWPKRHRAWLVHGDNLVDMVVSKLTAPRSGNVPDDLRELGLAAIFAYHKKESDFGSLWGWSDKGPLSPLEKIQLILYALDDDLDLTASFVRDVLALGYSISVANVAIWLHDLLTTFGWEPFLPAMLGLVHRWMKYNSTAALELLTSLAGLVNDDKAVCPPLRQPLQAELFKRCYDVVLATPGLVPKLFRSEEGWYGHGPDFLKNVLLLEHYVTTTAPQLGEANYVGHRLPPVLVAAVDSYVFAPRPSIMDMLPDSAANIISDIAVGLASAAVCQPSLPLPSKAIDRILRAVTDPDLDWYSMRRIRVDGIQSVLYLALATNRVDAALFEQCVILWDPKLLPALRTLCATQCPNFSTISPLVIAYIRRLPKSLVTPDCWRSSWYTDDEKIYKDASVAIGVLLLLDAIDLLQWLSPTTVVPFLRAWLAALPRTLEATHSLLAPVVMHGPTVKVLWRLASQLIARFEALPSLPTYVSFAMCDIKLEPAHCTQCREVHKFLQSPDDAELILYHCGLCNAIVRVINAHSTRLASPPHSYDGYSRTILKRPQPGQVTETEWKAHVVAIQRMASTATVVATVKERLRLANDERKTTKHPCQSDPGSITSSSNPRSTSSLHIIKTGRAFVSFAVLATTIRFF
ncbi:hypothetical protein SPRG_09989 [Saprolegnia parasitica CBS 223.65]|uniref:Uncharacterized protein n=1 Tax=Saprolegnia parasitica (strain CBS 223.65) TaxID=695850 RepID=A0A067C9J9_SAPPC|nr:hypothetical protein SPRG_09989 [Saprolegnia parasitica CBS 223.65]KDO23181.1 hypothetical protein SPRG_09989 [Saprolegnia parasitica CBS 223.65]|eukprot:XP_012206133.1 hypothetical protein SPRG_09989 [Saprolegnia parasitica CBS 223.65]